jgi:hypothetical protein
MPTKRKPSATYRALAANSRTLTSAYARADCSLAIRSHFCQLLKLLRKQYEWSRRRLARAEP